MTEWITGQVVKNKQWNNRLHSLQIQAEIPIFKAGQFTRLGLEIDGEIVSRPFSLVNAPGESPLDFYFIEVLGGKLSVPLAHMIPGDEVLIAPRASGLLTLDNVPSTKHLFLLSTGTGIGPFLSIIKTEQPWQQFDKVVLVHAVRTQDELTYQDTINRSLIEHSEQFIYVPFVSREQCDIALFGRIPQAILDGRLEQKTGLGFNAEDSHVMLCGNPDMVQETMDTLIEQRGLKKHSRRDPGQISIEKYW